ncbi:hypothetical protein QYF61_009096 [Mycteria americana]|uniref:Secreted protein n=1 Tax=Mycteria americana TaxID=33587 RepID=A0AAN7MSF5_MYCAM|nr:hypothetical protein QYF61_009096 [Mycteria americana]
MCRTLHLALLNFMRFALAHLNPVKVPLHGTPSLQRVNRTTQLGVISKLAEGALDPTVRVVKKDVKQHHSQYQPLRNTTRHWSPLGRGAIDHNSLSATIQPIPFPLSGPSIKSMAVTHLADTCAVSHLMVWDACSTVPVLRLLGVLLKQSMLRAEAGVQVVELPSSPLNVLQRGLSEV